MTSFLSVWFVTIVEGVLRFVFVALDAILGFLERLFNDDEKKKKTTRQPQQQRLRLIEQGSGGFSAATTRTQKQQEQKTVVIVGGSFAGLAALWELKEHNDDKQQQLRIVLIEQRDYCEYTPGILRLFCEPRLFPNLSGPLPRPAKDGSSSLEVIRGKAKEILDEEGRKILSYHECSGDPRRPVVAKSLPYDYLILATGSSYNYPITVSDDELSWRDRQRGWTKAHSELLAARSVLVLGGGAVGVELAAEIVDHYPTKNVTIVDAGPTLVTNFPKAVGRYAERWLESRGVTLYLGQKLAKWDATGCTFQNGLRLRADLVYVCFGSAPNHQAVSSTANNASRKLLFDHRMNVSVQDTLQVPVLDRSIFCTGDVAAPPMGAEKQAFQAETQGKVAARNVRRHLRGDRLLRYPRDVSETDSMPLVFVLSLGRHDGVLGFNDIQLPGPVAAVVKFILEYTKVLHLRGRLSGKLIWKLGDAVTFFLSRTIVKRSSTDHRRPHRDA